MIYLITGVPGSGKTLYAVSTLIQKLAAEKIKDKQGKLIVRRVVIDGIPDLLLPHEIMATRPDSESVGLRGKVGSESSLQDDSLDSGHGLWNWYKWCKPGDILVIDEAQRYWRPRGMGTKPPPEIQMLETHRHFGVDFIIITQNPMLIDQNVRRLIGRHQHVRRLLGMGRAVIYDWDSCSMDVHRTKSATTTMWKYPKNAYKLYRSAELHTKQRQKVPLWIAVPIIALIAGFAIAPTAFGVMRGAVSGKGISQSAVASKPAAAASSPEIVTMVKASSPGLPASSPVASGPLLAASAPDAVSKFAGCIKTAKRCGCFDSHGLSVKVDASECLDHLAGGVSKVDVLAHIPEPRDYARAAADAEVFAFMKRSHPSH